MRDFGTPDRVAPDYQAVLGVAASRRCSLTLLALLLPQAFLWDNGLRLIRPAVDPVELVAVLQATIKWLGSGAMLIALATGHCWCRSAVDTGWSLASTMGRLVIGAAWVLFVWLRRVERPVATLVLRGSFGGILLVLAIGVVQLWTSGSANLLPPIRDGRRRRTQHPWAGSCVG